MGPPEEHLISPQLFSSSLSLVPLLLYSPRWADTLFYFQNPPAVFPRRRINLHSICTTKDFYFKTPDGEGLRKSLTKLLGTSHPRLEHYEWQSKRLICDTNELWAFCKRAVPPLWPHIGICCVKWFLTLQLGGQRLFVKQKKPVSSILFLSVLLSDLLLSYAILLILLITFWWW